MIEIIKIYFPQLTSKQEEQFTALDTLYHDWNAKINVISRKDIDNLYEHHILHSLAIAKHISFREGTNVLDFGTGGGFPGIPLAIFFPEANFKLIDGTGKKVRVAQEVANAIGLDNVLPTHLRGEEEKGKFDFIVSRAVMPLPDLMKIVKKNIASDQHNVLPNGHNGLTKNGLRRNILSMYLDRSIFHIEIYNSISPTYSHYYYICLIYKYLK